MLQFDTGGGILGIVATVIGSCSMVTKAEADLQNQLQYHVNKETPVSMSKPEIVGLSPCHITLFWDNIHFRS